MEKRAIISVKSTSNLDPNEVIEVVTPGTFIIDEEGFKAIYEESEISGMDGTMAFSLYNTPYGVLNLNVDTEKLNININENGGEIYSKYTLGLDGQEGIVTELDIKIKVS